MAAFSSILLGCLSSQAVNAGHPPPLPSPDLDPRLLRAEKYTYPDRLIAPKSLARASQDRPDDSASPQQLQVFYVIPADGVDEGVDTNGAIEGAITRGQAWFSEQTGGRRFRLDTWQGALDIGFIRLTKTNAEMASLDLSHLLYELELALWPTHRGMPDLPDKRYMVFYGGDSAVYGCGMAHPLYRTAAVLLKAAAVNTYPCWKWALPSMASTSPTPWDYAWVHEHVHGLGLVAQCAPNLQTSNGGFHVLDSPDDVMFSPAAGDSRYWVQHQLLDYKRDDYYGHGRADCADLSKSVYLKGTDEPEPVAAIEYFHEGFGHYFVTAVADEIRELDSGRFSGWMRTGQAFKVWTTGTTRTDVCRFFSTAFAPKSSHFYTADAAECATVRQNGNWTFEGAVFQVGQPDTAGVCVWGLPLYRLYNGGQSGAPNHRYTTDLSIRAQMLALGFVPEGRGSQGVIGCVPR